MSKTFFRRRSRRRFRRKINGHLFIFLLVFGVFLLGGAAYYFANPLAAAVSSPPAGAESSRLHFIQQNTWLELLAQVIPGFRESVQTLPTPNGSTVQGETPQKFSPLMEFKDPKNILAAQIPYMRDTQVSVQPINRQPNNPQAPKEEPRIVLPLRNVVGQGKVVIYHTHTTESFMPTSGRPFTDNLELTVAQLGKELAEMLLKEYGISVVHNSTIHDIPRSGAYDVALPTIEQLLADNPDTKLVIDLHRDGVARSVSTMEVNGRAAGKVMFVVGAKHPNWQLNHQRALFLHGRLEELMPGLSRGIDVVQSLSYNQHIHSGALLIELGGHNNSLEEARRSLPYLAKAIAELYFAEN